MNTRDTNMFIDWSRKKIEFNSVIRECINFLSFVALVDSHWLEPGEQELEDNLCPLCLDIVSAIFLGLDCLMLVIYILAWLNYRITRPAKKERWRILENQDFQSEHQGFFGAKLSIDVVDDCITDIPIFACAIAYMVLREKPVSPIPIAVAGLTASKVLKHLWVWFAVDREFAGHILVGSEEYEEYEEYDAN